MSASRQSAQMIPQQCQGNTLSSIRLAGLLSEHVEGDRAGEIKDSLGCTCPLLSSHGGLFHQATKRRTREAIYQKVAGGKDGPDQEWKPDINSGLRVITKHQDRVLHCKTEPLLSRMLRRAGCASQRREAKGSLCAFSTVFLLSTEAVLKKLDQA